MNAEHECGKRVSASDSHAVMAHEIAELRKCIRDLIKWADCPKTDAVWRRAKELLGEE